MAASGRRRGYSNSLQHSRCQGWPSSRVARCPREKRCDGCNEREHPVRPGAAVHPHARGERCCCCACWAPCVGSSPRPWGTRSRTDHVRDGRRFIPTPVGNTTGTPARDSRPPVHPHARGEHHSNRRRRVAATGSSPRPWGTRSPGSYRRSPCPVHPHARGERCAMSAASSSSTGSSPRPWGTPGAGRGRDGSCRFIPTPVGNTGDGIQRQAHLTVHPHALGEHLHRVARDDIDHGSSPRPWGTPVARGLRANRRRFIPTPVGNTRASGPEWRSHPVHPHARGEHATRRFWATRQRGSSPRPWGTRLCISARRICSRFIPTPVGNTPRTTL